MYDMIIFQFNFGRGTFLWWIMIFKGHIILENGFEKLPIDKHEENLKEKAANFKKGGDGRIPFACQFYLRCEL